MVFFNDPLPCRRRGRTGGADGGRDARRGSTSSADGWRRRGHDLGFGIGIAQGFATLGRIGFEGRFDYAAIGSVTNLAARLCARGGARGRSSSPSGCSRRSRTSPSASPSANSTCGVQPAGPGLRCHGHRRDAREVEHVTTSSSTRPPAAAAATPVPTSTRTPAIARFDAPAGADAGGLGLDAAATSRTSRSSSSRRSASTVPVAGSGSLTQAYRGAVPLPAAAAAPTAAADDLRHVDADRPAGSSSTTWLCSRASSRATPAPASRWSRWTTRRPGR